MSNDTPADTVPVFAYGSLIYDRPFQVLKEEKGIIKGFARGFCIYSHVYRGTPENPGLVLGLEAGESCDGLVLYVASKDYQKIYDREMVTSVYEETLVPVQTENGVVSAKTFICKINHPQYAGKLSLIEQANIIRGANGKGGPNIDYLINSTNALKQYDICDSNMEKLVDYCQ